MMYINTHVERPARTSCFINSATFVACFALAFDYRSKFLCFAARCSELINQPECHRPLYVKNQSSKTPFSVAELSAFVGQHAVDGVAQ